MAINIYGSCSGTLGSKYNIRLNITQNSQSIEENKSNVTVKLLLKRNDGYAASSYNLDENANSVVLKVGGKERVNKNLAIDTRDNVTVTLAAWTGDVAHKDDGSLALAVSGSFTMSGTSLSGGSVSGSFNCTDIPRESTLTLSKTSVNPLDSVGATITAASSAFSHKIKWYLGNSSVTHNITAGGNQDIFTVPVSWAEEVTNSKSADISVSLATYKGTKKIGTKNYSLKLIIPETENFLPRFDFVVERIDNSVPARLNEYIKGKSQVKIDIRNPEMMYGATLFSCTAKVGSASKTKLPATFDLPKSGEITISLTVKDSRGISVKKSEKINVVNYSTPTVSVKSLYRCDELGNKTTLGNYLLCELDKVYSSVNEKNIPKVTCKYRKAEGGSFSDETEILNNPLILGNGEFLNNSSYILALKITDSITTENDFYEAFVPSSDIAFNIRNGGKGAAFGCYSERENELTVGWDLNVKGDLFYENADIEMTELTEDKTGVARYIPCLEIVIVRLRFTAAHVITPGENRIIASFKDKIPKLVTPLSVMVNNGVNNNCTGYVKSGTGDLVISPQADIDKGDYIYVSGVYFSYRS